MRKFLIAEQTLNNVLGYLAKHPFAEVNGLIEQVTREIQEHVRETEEKKAEG